MCNDNKAAAPQPPAQPAGEFDVLAITTAYEQGVGKGHQAFKRKVEIDNPYAPGDCNEAWWLGYCEGKEQAAREAPPEKTLSQRMLDAGMTRRPTWRAFPEDAEDAEGEAQPEDGRCDHHACIYPMCDCEAQPAAKQCTCGEPSTPGTHRHDGRPCYAVQPAADDKDSNAPWLTEAHMLCTDAGIPHGNIIERIKALREKLADDKTGGEFVVHQYQDKDGTWCNFINQKHYENTLSAGRWPIRALYTRPQPQAESAAWRDHVEQRLFTWRRRIMNRDGDQLALDDFMDKESIDDLLDYVLDEYAIPNPQAESGRHGKAFVPADRKVVFPGDPIEAPDTGLLDAAKKYLEALNGRQWAIRIMRSDPELVDREKQLLAAIAKESGK